MLNRKGNFYQGFGALSRRALCSPDVWSAWRSCPEPSFPCGHGFCTGFTCSSPKSLPAFAIPPAFSCSSSSSPSVFLTNYILMYNFFIRKAFPWFFRGTSAGEIIIWILKKKKVFLGCQLSRSQASPSKDTQRYFSSKYYRALSLKVYWLKRAPSLLRSELLSPRILQINASYTASFSSAGPSKLVLPSRPCHCHCAPSPFTGSALLPAVPWTENYAQAVA